MESLRACRVARLARLRLTLHENDFEEKPTVLQSTLSIPRGPLLLAGNKRKLKFIA